MFFTSSLSQKPFKKISFLKKISCVVPVFRIPLAVFPHSGFSLGTVGPMRYGSQVKQSVSPGVDG